MKPINAYIQAKNQINPNLFNQKTITDGKQLNITDLLDAPTYFTSGYIPVEINGQYLSSNVRNVAFYDSSYNPLSSGFNLIGQKSNAIISVYDPSNIKYMRFSALKTALAGAYMYKVPSQLQSRLFNKVIVVLGDSLTGQNNWQPYLRRRLGAFVNNYGVGGTKVADTTGVDTTAMCRDERINAMLSFCDYCIFLGGTNDWGQNAPIGTITDTGTDTFYGALKVVAQKLTTRYPTNKIIFVAPPYSLVPGKVGWTDTTGEKNNSGLSIADYGIAIKEVARMYGFPFVDLYANCGWNSINIQSFMQVETNALVHPNSGAGAERMAIEIVRRLNELADLA